MKVRLRSSLLLLSFVFLLPCLVNAESLEISAYELKAPNDTKENFALTFDNNSSDIRTISDTMGNGLTALSADASSTTTVTEERYCCADESRGFSEEMIKGANCTVMNSGDTCDKSRGVISDECVLGSNVTKDLKGALNIFRIAGAVLVIVMTIVDAIKSLAAQDAQAQIQPFFIKLLKRIAAAIGIVVVPLLLMWILDFLGMTNCDITSTNTTSTETTTAK